MIPSVLRKEAMILSICPARELIAASHFEFRRKSAGYKQGKDSLFFRGQISKADAKDTRDTQITLFCQAETSFTRAVANVLPN